MTERATCCRSQSAVRVAFVSQAARAQTHTDTWNTLCCIKHTFRRLTSSGGSAAAPPTKRPDESRAPNMIRRCPVGAVCCDRFQFFNLAACGLCVSGAQLALARAAGATSRRFELFELSEIMEVPYCCAGGQTPRAASLRRTVNWTDRQTDGRAEESGWKQLSLRATVRRARPFRRCRTQSAAHSLPHTVCRTQSAAQSARRLWRQLCAGTSRCCAGAGRSAWGRKIKLNTQ